jgi:hypothetical protein
MCSFSFHSTRIVWILSRSTRLTILVQFSKPLSQIYNRTLLYLDLFDLSSQTSFSTIRFITEDFLHKPFYSECHPCDYFYDHWGNKAGQMSYHRMNNLKVLVCMPFHMPLWSMPCSISLSAFFTVTRFYSIMRINVKLERQFTLKYYWSSFACKSFCSCMVFHVNFQNIVSPYTSHLDSFVLLNI